MWNNYADAILDRQLKSKDANISFGVLEKNHLFFMHEIVFTISISYRNHKTGLKRPDPTRRRDAIRLLVEWRRIALETGQVTKQYSDWRQLGRVVRNHTAAQLRPISVSPGTC